MWLDNCGSETLSSWISRATKPPQPCMALKHIDGDEFYKTYLLNVSFTNMVGNLFRFDAQGDGPAIYTILNYQPDLHSPFKHSSVNDIETDRSSRNDYKEVGRWHDGLLEIDEDMLFWRVDDVENGTMTPTPLSVCSLPCHVGFNKQLIKDEMCCWACAKCEPWEYLANETTCVECQLGWWPTPDRTTCYNLAEKELKHMIWASWYSVVPSILSVIGIICTVMVIIIYIRHNETPIVKASGRELSYILLGAIIICYLMTFILLAKPTAIICAFKRTGVGFGFSVLYSAMLVKTNRIYRIFSQARMSAQRPRFISPLSQVVITVMLASVQLFASLIWLLIAPPGTRDHYPDRSQVVLTCNVADHLFLVSLSYDALLIVLCTVYAVKTRKVPENFNEAKFIGFTMYTTCIIWLSFVPIYFGTGTDFQIQTTTLCISISMSANVALVCIFSPKLWIIVIEPEKNVRKQCGESMMTKRSTPAGTLDEASPPTQYSALLGDQRRRTSQRLSQADSSAPTARGSLTNSTFVSSPQMQQNNETTPAPTGVQKRKRQPPTENTTGYESLEEESLTSV
uniref:G-protein coupled receptors family 3 profile domain-containing protein n=1 Tax=Plectus sambesii TaxID=2011161 RepID=A0A914W7D8_9BILA